MRIRLSDEDRERLGGPEWLEVDTDRFTVGEAQKVEEAGLPAGAFLGRGFATLLTRIWIGLFRAGVTPPASVGDMEFINLAGLRVEDESPGKAPSARSGARTRSTSATPRTGTSKRTTSKR